MNKLLELWATRIDILAGCIILLILPSEEVGRAWRYCNTKTTRTKIRLIS